MKRTSKVALAARMREGWAWRAVFACMLGVAALVFSPCAEAQGATPAQRTVFGIVKNSAGVPADNAVVYLQDTKSMVIRSYVANGGGHFHFNQLSPDTDYQVWAEINKHKSKIKIVSMFSSHVKFQYTLKIKG